MAYLIRCAKSGSEEIRYTICVYLEIKSIKFQYDELLSLVDDKEGLEGRRRPRMTCPDIVDDNEEPEELARHE